MDVTIIGYVRICVDHLGLHQGQIGPKNRPKPLSTSHFCQNTKFLKIVLTLSLSYERIPLVKIPAKLSDMWGWEGVETPPSSKKKKKKMGLFHGSWIGTRTLKICNLTTSNATLTKLPSIMYIHESVNEKPLKMNQKIKFFGPNFTISLE